LVIQEDNIMRRVLAIGPSLTAGFLFLAFTSGIQAMMIRMASLPERVAMSDAVVVGKVIEIEKKNVSARQFPETKDKVEYQVAVIQVKEAPLGAKGLTHVRVAFVPPQAAPARGPGPIRPGLRRPAITLTKGQEGCFFLQQHFEESFYVLVPGTDPLDKKSQTFAKEVAQVKRYAKLLASPTAGLKSKDANERTLTAGLLLVRYRSPRPGEMKSEPIDAEQSKLILKALAQGDFNKPITATDLSAQQVFFRLNLTEKDGWKPGPFKNFQTEFPAAAKKWLKDHAETYRIERFVSDKAEKKD
jgi:hypothetical protein